MNNHLEKTIPYKLSPAELEYFRILRKRTNPSSSFLDEKDRRISEELEAWNSDPTRFEQKEDGKS